MSGMVLFKRLWHQMQYFLTIIYKNILAIYINLNAIKVEKQQII